MKPCLAAFLSLVASVASSQSIDLLTLSYKNGFTQSMESGTGEATEHVALVNLKAPLVFSDTTIWYNDLTYQHFIVDFSGNTNIDPVRLHGFMFQTGLVRKLSATTGFQVLLVPRLMSDLREIDVHHFQLGGIGLFEKRYSKTLMLRYGLMYNRDLFGHMFVPLVYVDWRPGSKWSVSGLLPIFAKVSFQVNSKLAVGLSHFGLITSYQLGAVAYNRDYIERKSVDLSLFGRYRVAGNLHFETRFGYALGRSYRQYAKGDELDFRVTVASFGDDRTQKNTDFDAGPFVDVRLVYNLPLK